MSIAAMRAEEFSFSKYLTHCNFTVPASAGNVGERAIATESQYLGGKKAAELRFQSSSTKASNPRNRELIY